MERQEQDRIPVVLEDIKCARLFASFDGDVGKGFFGCGLCDPRAIAYYRQICGVMEIHDPFRATAVWCCIGYPVKDPSFSECDRWPEPFYDGEFFYGNAIAQVREFDGIGHEIVRRFIRSRWPKCKWMYGIRGHRKTRPLRV